MNPFVKQLKLALELDRPYRYPLPSDGVPAAVFILLAPTQNAENEYSVLLTKRTEKVESHKGQISFPGGVKDAQDDLREGLLTTAFRETFEEVGIASHFIEMLGKLPAFWVTSGYTITPFVGVLKSSHQELEQSMILSADEIDFVFWAPLKSLRLEEVYREELMEYRGKPYLIDVFQWEQHRIWGATGAILKNLLDRLSQTE